MAEFLTTPGGMALIIAAQVLLVIGFVMISLLFLVYGDRKIWAAVQMRRGPNVVGAFGLLQTVADALKYVVKEIVIPAGADRAVFMLAPMLSFVLAMIAWAVIPFNETWVLADINVAILYVFAISSLHVYGVIMGGWASNSKYPFLGSLRSAAQMISYEVSIGLIIIGVILSTGSMNFGDIVRAQDTGWGLLGWYWLPHLPMVALFFISALAETNRPPFDLPEAESELVAGYQVEYSSTPFLLFMAGEYISIFLMCALMSLLFFGGWLSPIPGLPDGALWMVAKMAFFFFLIAMVKAIVPRYRYDQLMRIGWKVFLPLSLAWVVIVAFLAHFECSAASGRAGRWGLGHDAFPPSRRAGGRASGCGAGRLRDGRGPVSRRHLDARNCGYPSPEGRTPGRTRSDAALAGGGRDVCRGRRQPCHDVASEPRSAGRGRSAGGRGGDDLLEHPRRRPTGNGGRGDDADIGQPSAGEARGACRNRAGDAAMSAVFVATEVTR
jgi:NADH-quinone oxidoreductase subunit H